MFVDKGSSYGGAKAPGTPGQTKFDRTFSPKPKKNLTKACDAKKLEKGCGHKKQKMMKSVYADPMMQEDMATCDECPKDCTEVMCPVCMGCIGCIGSTPED